MSSCLSSDKIIYKDVFEEELVTVSTRQIVGVLVLQIVHVLSSGDVIVYGKASNANDVLLKCPVQASPERLIFLCGNQQQSRIPSDISFSLDANKQQRQLIAELENKNR